MVKQARAARLPAGSGKAPRAAANALPPGEDTKPVWRFSRLDFDGPFGCRKLTPEKLEEVVKTLGQFETMTWAEIKGGKHHSVDVGGTCKEARARLNETNNEDLESLFSLRLSGKERIYGILERSTLYILWWDPEHQVYPSPKKHT